MVEHDDDLTMVRKFDASSFPEPNGEMVQVDAANDNVSRGRTATIADGIFMIAMVSILGAVDNWIAS